MKKEKPKPKWITMVRRKDGRAVPFDSLSPDEKSRIAGNIERKTAEIIAREMGLEVHFGNEPLERAE